jgi:hypothetical protein
MEVFFDTEEDDQNDIYANEEEIQVANLIQAQLNINDTEEDPMAPSIKFNTMHVIRARRKWEMSVIIKLLGRNIGFKILIERIRNLCILSNLKLF